LIIPLKQVVNSFHGKKEFVFSGKWNKTILLIKGSSAFIEGVHEYRD